MISTTTRTIPTFIRQPLGAHPSAQLWSAIYSLFSILIPGALLTVRPSNTRRSKMIRSRSSQHRSAITLKVILPPDDRRSTLKLNYEKLSRPSNRVAAPISVLINIPNHWSSAADKARDRTRRLYQQRQGAPAAAGYTVVGTFCPKPTWWRHWWTFIAHFLFYTDTARPEHNVLQFHD